MRVPSAQVYFPDKDRQDILAHLDEALKTGQLTLGKYGREFEERFCCEVGSRYAIAVNSGTSAIEIAMRVLGVEGREVLVPTNTFFATPAAVIHAGGRVKFVDVDPQTFSIDVDSLLHSITPTTAGVIVVHIGGIITPRLAEICDLCHQRGLFVFEDAAHAHGSTFNNQKAGTFGDTAAFSFYPTKVMTSAEGGMLVTDSPFIYEEAVRYRDQGKASFTSNVHTHLGYNWRMSEPHAIIGLTQLQRLEEFIAARQRIARVYDQRLLYAPGLTPLPIPDGCRTNYYKYIALLDPDLDRAALKQTLREQHGVSLSGEVYELPCHQQPVFADHRPQTTDHRPLPIAEDLCRRHVCLPISACMTPKEAHYVVDVLVDTIQKMREHPVSCEQLSVTSHRLSVVA
jgi:dTDP-4-amino-4,6-dideoxygalactose transaminase